MEKNTKTYKRNINPENRPGAKAIYGERLNKVLIVKINDELAEKLDVYSKNASKKQSEVIRDFIETL